MFEAFEIVRERQFKIARALENADVRYALSGSNATFLWIASVDESGVRAYRHVEFIIRREDQQRAENVLTEMGLEAESKVECIFFRNWPDRRDYWSDRALFANEMLAKNSCRVPDIEATEILDGVHVLPLPILVEFQLSRWTLDDKVDLRDMIDIGLLDSTWVNRLSAELAACLQHLLDTPEG